MDEAYDREVVEAVRRFVDRDVIPTANDLEHEDAYPHALVAKMKELGLLRRHDSTRAWRPRPQLHQLRPHHGRIIARMDESCRCHQQPSHHGLYHRQSWHGRAKKTLPACDGQQVKSAAASH